jgi:hypothetical protein
MPSLFRIGTEETRPLRLTTHRSLSGVLLEMRELIIVRRLNLKIHSAAGSSLYNARA